jgi:hypothetical protein
MDLLMNGLLTVATLFAGGYCWVLARRVRDLKSLDKGLGGAIVTLTRQIELARTTLDEARAASKSSKQELSVLVARADAAAGHLRLLLAAAPAVPAGAAAPDRPPAPAPTPQAALEPLVATRTAEAPADAAAPPAQEPAPRPSRRAGALLSMLAKAPAEEPTAAAEPAADVPKPRVLVPIENPLRRFRPDASEPVVASEDDILEALRALAGSER